MTSLVGKVAVVTGSSRGIGRAIAERLGREGASVVVNYRENAAQAQAAVAAISAAGGGAIAVQADLAVVAEVRRLFGTAVAQFGRLDIVVTNAGTARWGAVADVSEADYDAVFQLNAKGTFFALQEAARHIADGGRIVNVTSSATAMSIPGLALYVGSKAVGEQFARTLAKELGPRGVTVNSISPGFTETDMLPEDPAYRAMAAEMSFLGRIGQPDDIADVVAFLVSDEARWITGQNIQAGGGVVA
jgi:3-oxoacyl-[acyl-carrier protein] reductase